MSHHFFFNFYGVPFSVSFPYKTKKIKLDLELKLLKMLNNQNGQ